MKHVPWYVEADYVEMFIKNRTETKQYAQFSK